MIWKKIMSKKGALSEQNSVDDEFSSVLRGLCHTEYVLFRFDVSKLRRNNVQALQINSEKSFLSRNRNGALGRSRDWTPFHILGRYLSLNQNLKEGNVSILSLP